MGTSVRHGKLIKLAGTTAENGTSEAGIISAIEACGHTAKEQVFKQKRKASRALFSSPECNDRAVALYCVDGDDHWVMGYTLGFGRQILVYDPEPGEFSLHTSRTFLKMWQSKDGTYYRIVLGGKTDS